jgi:ABC-type Mn2+/Zn2+ transport system ATPase subunit
MIQYYVVHDVRILEKNFLECDHIPTLSSDTNVENCEDSEIGRLGGGGNRKVLDASMLMNSERLGRFEIMGG